MVSGCGKRFAFWIPIGIDRAQRDTFTIHYSPFIIHRLKAPLLALTLLMLGVLADYHDLTVSLDNLALLTHFLN